MKENIDNDEKMMPFRVHDNRWCYSGKLWNYALWRLWPRTSDLVIPTLLWNTGQLPIPLSHTRQPVAYRQVQLRQLSTRNDVVFISNILQ